jgi:dGTP triphosphohydrolase
MKALENSRFNEKFSKGRINSMDEDYIYFNSNSYKIDINKILNSKANRRLPYKTQVFSQPINKHIRTRKSHTEEVYTMSQFISDALGLNTDLCLAIAAGHDLGHFPYGHTTEHNFTKELRLSTGNNNLTLDHSLMGVIISHLVERKGSGLNLTYETMEGILNHSTGGGDFKLTKNLPLEYSVVRYADKICYLFSDINDAERLGMLKPNKKEFEPIYSKLKLFDKVFGNEKVFFSSNQRKRNYMCFQSLINESTKKGFVSFSEGEIFNSFETIRKKMYELVYNKIDWDIQNLMIKKITDVLEKSSINDYVNYFKKTLKVYEKFCKTNWLIIKKPDNKPHPFLVISLLTDNDIETLISKRAKTNSLTFKDVMDNTNLQETLPYLLYNNIDLVDLSIKWGNFGKSNPAKFLNDFLKPI